MQVVVISHVWPVARIDLVKEAEKFLAVKWRQLGVRGEFSRQVHDKLVCDGGKSVLASQKVTHLEAVEVNRGDGLGQLCVSIEFGEDGTDAKRFNEAAHQHFRYSHHWFVLSMSMWAARRVVRGWVVPDFLNQRYIDLLQVEEGVFLHPLWGLSSSPDDLAIVAAFVGGSSVAQLRQIWKLEVLRFTLIYRIFVGRWWLFALFQPS